MAKRTWRAWPDAIYQAADGTEIPFVSRDRLLEAVLDGVSFLDRSGGTLIVTVGRQPTEMEGEALTTGVAVRWQDGPRARVQAEAPVEVPTPVVVQPQPAAPEDFEGEAFDDDNPDGLDPETLDDEDLSAIPEALR